LATCRFFGIKVFFLLSGGSGTVARNVDHIRSGVDIMAEYQGGP